MSNMEKVAAQRSLLEGHDLSFFADVPVVYHCHHFNLFLDQTVEDALGGKVSAAVRTEAAREASYELLSGLTRAVGADTPAERLELARTVFAAMGHGRLEVLAGKEGGRARGEYLHYGYSWQQKYGSVVTRRRPADMFAAGFAAAALEVAFDLPRETVASEETTCIAMRSPTCEFDLTPGEQASPRTRVDRTACGAVVKPTFTGQEEDRISTIASGLRDFTAGVAGDERGLVQAFGVFVTLHLAGYYNRISYDTIKRVAEVAPKSEPVLAALLRESGHVCVFNTFGGIILSPEWEGMVGPVQGDVEEIVSACCAIGRALGFGHWTIGELVPNERLVLRTPSTYESGYCVTRNGVSGASRCYFLQGAALAMMQLAHRVSWRESPELTQEFYNDLFRRGVPWKVEETRCVCRGDEMCEAVVSAS
jgi:hypothetical protein